MLSRLFIALVRALLVACVFGVLAIGLWSKPKAIPEPERTLRPEPEQKVRLEKSQLPREYPKAGEK